MAGIVSLLSQMFVPQTTQVAAPVRSTTSNPYSNNPFVNYNGNSLNSYAKNSPVRGGYFAWILQWKTKHCRTTSVHRSLTPIQLTIS